MLTTDVENYPGFPEGILGPELMARFREQAERFGAEFVTADADRVDFSGSPHRVWVGDTEYTTNAIIISTGAKARMLGLPSEQALLGHGVSTCATCDGFFFRGQNIAVVGGGDSALEEATFLTTFADKVTLVHRRKELRGSKIMQDRAFANPKIEFRWNSVVEHVLGDGRVEALDLRDVETGATEQARASPGLFVAIGHDPNTAAVRRPARPRRERLHRHRQPGTTRRRSRACSRPATCRTTSTARRSPPPGRAAWPRSKPSGISKRSPTPPAPSPRKEHPWLKES